MKTIRPRIGITGPDRGGRAAWFFAALAVYRAGGFPRRVTCRHQLSMAELDGLVVGGGMDLDPSLYGGEVQPVLEEIRHSPPTSRHPFIERWVLPVIYLLRRLFSVKTPVWADRPRDDMEVALVKEALAQNKPILGICRGAQLLNAALGGSLHQEIRGFYTETPYIRSVLAKKRITIVPNTRLASLLPRSFYWVSSLHHQAIHHVAPGLRVAAREDSLLIQAIEYPDKKFVFGVQWHPEFMPHAPSQQILFQHLIQNAVSDSEK
jgi:putative glutamine amidotransferase